MKKFTVCIVIFSSFFFKQNLLYAQVNTGDSLALVDLFNNTKGRQWKTHTKWLTKAPVSTWYGITVSGNRVTKILLNNNSLKGTMPASLGKLKKLTNLVLDHNYLEGSIPSSLGKLANLVHLNLYNNYKLSGNIPALGNLQKLEYLSLGFNSLTGNIPAELGSLQKLKFIDLSSNKLTGNIPELGSLDSLAHLQLAVNQLTGSIPVSLSNLTHLQFLDLWSNQLSGSIPPGLNNLSELTYLALGSNQLSGNIPTLKKLQHLNTLDLSFNWFTFDGMEQVARTFPFAQYGGQAYIPLLKNGNVLSVTAGGTLSRNRYTWYKDGHIYIKKAGDSTVTIHASGTYFVAVTNSVAKESILYSETTQYNQADNLISSTINHPIAGINIYPNPANANTTLSFNATGKYLVTITDLSGKVLETKTGIATKSRNHIQLDATRYLPGMYMVSVTSGTNKQTIRLLKK